MHPPQPPAGLPSKHLRTAEASRRLTAEAGRVSTVVGYFPTPQANARPLPLWFATPSIYNRLQESGIALCRLFSVGRAGIEPATLGLKSCGNRTAVIEDRCCELDSLVRLAEANCTLWRPSPTRAYSRVLLLRL